MSGEWRSVSLDILKLEQALQVFRDDLRLLIQNKNPFSLDKKAQLQERIEWEIERFEKRLKIFEWDYHEVEEIYHTRLLKEAHELAAQVTDECASVEKMTLKFRSTFFNGKGYNNPTWRDVDSDVDSDVEDDGKTDGEESPAKGFDY